MLGRAKLVKRATLLLVVVFILILSLFSGCRETVEYSFNDSDIIAYVNSEPVYKSEMERYIYFKQLFMEEIVVAGPEQYIGKYDKDDIEFVRGVLNSKAFYIANYNNAVEYIKLSVEEKEKDYYRSLVTRQTNEEKQPNLLPSLDGSVDYTVQGAYELDVPFSIDGDSTIYISDIINNVAEEFNISYEECVETTFKLYITNELAESYLLFYFEGNEYNGDNIKYDGANDEEYTKSVLAKLDGFDEYKQKLLKECEIVERP